MKKIHITKKLVIVLLLALIVNVAFSNYLQAVDSALSGADDFLGKRRCSVERYR